MKIQLILLFNQAGNGKGPMGNIDLGNLSVMKNGKIIGFLLIRGILSFLRVSGLWMMSASFIRSRPSFLRLAPLFLKLFQLLPDLTYLGFRLFQGSGIVHDKIGVGLFLFDGQLGR